MAKENFRIVLITANNAISRIMVSEILSNSHQAISKVVAVGNVSPTTTKGKNLLRKWLSDVSIKFVIMKIFEIYVDTFLAKLKKKDIKSICKKFEVPYLRILDQDQDKLAHLLDFEFDYLISTGPAILSSKVLNKARIMNLNLHGGDLPTYKGLANYVWMMIDHQTEAIVTMHELIERIDAGRNISKISFPIDPNWSAFELNFRMSYSMARLANDFIHNLEYEDAIHFLPIDKFVIEKYNSLPNSSDIKKLKLNDKKLFNVRDFFLLGH